MTGQRGPSSDAVPSSSRPPLEPPQFDMVLRGYDRIEVDEYVRDARRTTQKLQAELAQSEERRRRAEQHA